MNIRERLQEDERRRLGTSNSVSSQILRRPEEFGELFEAFFDEEPSVRVRAAEAAEKATRVRPDLLVPLRKRLIAEAGELPQHQIRESVARMLPRIKLEPHERARAVALLHRYVADETPALVLCALQSLTDFSNDDAVLREKTIRLLETFERQATAETFKVRLARMLARLRSQHDRRRPAAKPRR
ncbi:MAG: hypothetical protein M3R51_08820 [Candidatus Eremiobacteraeota bacterium]|nr:hypothetical protein [Candidatus Eremiobacteraeota bacterium]